LGSKGQEDEVELTLQHVAGLLLIIGILLLLPEIIIMNRLWQPGLKFGIPVFNVTSDKRLISKSSLPSGLFRVGKIDCRRNTSDSIGINTLPTYGLEEWRFTVPLKTWLSIGRGGVVALEARLPISLTFLALGSVVLLWSNFRAPLAVVGASLVFLILGYAGVRQSRWSGRRVLEFLLDRGNNA
jgi:hypothetical protein